MCSRRVSILFFLIFIRSTKICWVPLINKVMNLKYKPGTRRGGLLKGCLGLCGGEKKKKIVFLSSLPRAEKITLRNRAQWLFRIASVPLTQWLLTGSPVIISSSHVKLCCQGCTGTGPCGVRTAVWSPKLMNTKAQSQFVHHWVARQQGTGRWRGLCHTHLHVNPAALLAIEHNTFLMILRSSHLVFFSA